jgi:polygalacturonase
LILCPQLEQVVTMRAPASTWLANNLTLARAIARAIARATDASPLAIAGTPQHSVAATFAAKPLRPRSSTTLRPNSGWLYRFNHTDEEWDEVKLSVRQHEEKLYGYATSETGI